MEFIKQKAGFAAAHVSYKGCQSGLTDVLGGPQVPLAIRALMGPAQLPADIVAKIEADTRRVLAEVEVRERLSQAGVEPMDGDGTALAQLISADLARYADLARAAGIKAE